MHTLDDFASFPYLFKLNANALLDVVHPRAGTALALPGAHGNGNVLAIRPSAAGSAFSFGRRFPLAESWNGRSGITFWYHGQHTGKHITVTVLGQQAADPGPTGWRLTWSDEFNGLAGTPPDPTVWNHEVGDGSAQGIPGWGNQELETYTDSTQNAALDGSGNLVITARKVPADQQLTCYYGPCKYTSARLTTEKKFELAYGRIEARIKLPAGAGMWPAFWMLGTNIAKVNWPQSGEIDVMENVGRDPEKLFGTIHGPGYEGVGVGGTYTAAVPLSDGYHTYAIEWQPNRISWSIDGTPYFTARKSDVAPNPWVFNHPFFLLLNLAVGGQLGGPVGSDTTFPQSIAVDYIRVYSAPDTAARFQASFADSFSGWRRITLPFSSFKRSPHQPTGAPTGPLDLKHVWGYTFTVPAGFKDTVHVAKIGLTSGNCS